MILKKKSTRKLIDEEIYNLLTELKKWDANSDQYAELLCRIQELNNLKNNTGISNDARATIAANLLGILLILNYEKINVLTSKALGFVVRGRV